MSATFNAKKKRLWCHGPKPEYALDTDWADQWYIGARTLSLVRPGKDLIILPGENRQTQEFANFCISALGLTADQILWTSGKSYLMDDDIRKELLARLERQINPREWEIIPYSVTEPFLRWASQTGAPIFGDDERWVRTYSNKSILHPNAIHELRDPLLPLLSEEVAGLRLPRGYTCTTAKELARALDLLRAAGVQKFILKPVVGTTGEGILLIETKNQIKDYAFPMGAVVLEECLEIDIDAQGRKISPSVQYLGQKLSADVTDQTFKDVAYEGNIIPSATSLEFQHELLEMAKRVVRRLAPQGPGGFDFLSVRGKPVLVDPNVGRFTGAHPAKIFRALYAPKMPVACFKIDPTKELGAVWEELNQRGIAFAPAGRRTGVFPLCYLREMWGQLIVFGQDKRELARFRAQAEDCL